MAWRVAIASIDGILVTEHFGRSRWFYIFDIRRDGTGTLVERRDVNPPCGNGGHTDGGMEQTIAVLGDCAAVLAARIGPAARKRLEMAGISPFDEPVIAEEAFKKLAVYYGRTNFPENS
ncbi:MAG: dinitrogenase iron-molybdenum cofactor biosynthesis protein [Spirochaetaceae bacterium]|jgi:predicted Fe-Mo cluster-binding NifX family protein|nr:dinitrogenase iron-molybdenum cofactor biosynthesis protein [Spirochaetaceae bacterium]